ncbi:MAG: phosphoglycolate phosphatase [Roseobacter sp.]
MATPDAIIFDLDGTLIHSAPDLHAAVNVALVGLGRQPLSLETVISFIGNGVEKLVERSLAATGGGEIELHPATLDVFLKAYAADKVTLTQPYDGVLDQLTALKNAGIPMGVCTNKPQDPAREICDLLGLTHFFGDISGALADMPKKPDAAPLLEVARRLGAEPSRTLYVGDSVVDYETARAAQMPFLLFKGGYLNAPLSQLAPTQVFKTWSDVAFSLG